MDLGNELRSAREQAGVSRQELAQRLNTPLAEIEALENNRFDRLRDDIYAEGVVRAFAREMGLDATVLVQHLRSQYRSGVNDGAGSDLVDQSMDTVRAMFAQEPRAFLPPDGYRRHLRGRSAAAALILGILAGFGLGVSLYGTYPFGAARTSDATASSTNASSSSGVLAPEARAAVDPTGLSDVWILTTMVESTNYAAFQGLKLGYQLELGQHGKQVSGSGYKVSENGRTISATARTPIEVEGTADDERLILTFTEHGTRRQSTGTMVLMREDNDILRGRFSSDAARSEGFVEARRRTGQPRCPEGTTCP